MPDAGRGTAAAEASLGGGVVAIVLMGVALGVAYNALGLASRPGWGLAWLATDPVAALPTLDAVGTPSSAGDAGSFHTTVSDPMAIAGADEDGTKLPDVPQVDRPIQIGVAAARQFFDRSAAVFVDARDRDEYTAGHVPGALSLPYDEVVSEPERLQRLDAGGKPIIVYCGGGACELSIRLAEELIVAGQKRVLVYMGGLPEWAAAGHPVARGGPAK